MEEAWTMTSVRAKSAGLKCYIACHWEGNERKIAMIKSFEAEKENKDKR